MEDREIENFKTLQKKKDRYNLNGNGARGNGITSSDGVSSRNRIQQLMESANGVPPIRARYRNSRKNEAKNDSDNGKHKQGKQDIRHILQLMDKIDKTFRNLQSAALPEFI